MALSLKPPGGKIPWERMTKTAFNRFLRIPLYHFDALIHMAYKKNTPQSR